MQANSWHHKLFHFHLSFRIWKKWKRGKKLQKFEYLKNKKTFSDEIKNTFHNFWRAIIWWKIKNLIKNMDTSFKSIKRIYTCAPDYGYSHKNLWDPPLTMSFLIDISLMMKHFTIDWNNSFLKEKIIWFIVYKTLFVNPFQANVPFLYSSFSNRGF